MLTQNPYLCTCRLRGLTEVQKTQLLATPVVQQYLAEANPVGADDGRMEDFA